MKEVFCRILKILSIVFIFGSILFVVFLFASFGMTPPYVTRMIPVVGIAIIILAVLNSDDIFGKRLRRAGGVAFLAMLVFASVYIGKGVYKDSLPTVDDRSSLLHDYEPFAAGTKAVYLDEESTLKFTPNQMLRLDGATALYPVYSAFVQAVYPEGRYKFYDGVVDCNGTIHAYERLINRETDIIFAAAPSQAQLDMAAAKGMELHLTPIGREAFVFFVNSKNPVSKVTVENIQGIYTGQINNWKELGGKNQRIRPFQRDENSGSQSALLRLMDGLPLIEPEEEDRIAGMGGIIRDVADYRNYSNAIGFSFRFYSTEMVKNGDIKLLALNGVEPTKETIRDGSYPIASEFYAVTASPIGKPAPEEYDEDMEAFLKWILSPQGQGLIEETGYVSLK